VKSFLSDLLNGKQIGVLGFDFRRGLGIFLFTTVSRTVLGPTQPPIQQVPGALSLGVKRPGREADLSPPSSAEVKNAWSYTCTPEYVFMAWCLVKHRDNFIFTFTKYAFRFEILMTSVFDIESKRASIYAFLRCAAFSMNAATA
jgi:hypothetical protein